MRGLFLLLFGPILTVVVFLQTYEADTLTCDRTVDRCTFSRRTLLSEGEVRPFPARELLSATFDPAPARKGASLDQRIEIQLRSGARIPFVAHPFFLDDTEVKRKAGRLYAFAHDPKIERVDVSHDNRATASMVSGILFLFQTVITVILLRGRRRSERRRELRR